MLTRRAYSEIKRAVARHANLVGAKTARIAEGANGNAYKVMFADGSTGVLKVQKGAGKDNLMYEFLVGEKLNVLRFRFPQFIETKDIYYYHDSKLSELRELEVLEPHSLDRGCRTAGRQALLIKHVNGATLKSFMSDPEFLKNELVGVLFQIYYTLYKLQHVFTHYDLHKSNVLLDTPTNGKPILFRYTEFTPPVEFTCRFVPKIIDYGRAYMEGVDFSKLWGLACNTAACAPQGRKCGFNYYNSEYQNYTRPNVSQDLRLLVGLPDPFAWLSGMVVYGNNVPEKKVRYTTQEIVTPQYPVSIVNVDDAFHALYDLVLEQNLREHTAVITISGSDPYTANDLQRPRTRKNRHG